MKKIINSCFIAVLSISVSLPALADSPCAGLLPQITLQLSAEQWVTTHTANVSVTLDALLNKEQLAKAQDNFQAALRKIAPEGAWHITEFTRSPSKTSLEQLHAVAEARLPDTAIAGIRDRVQGQNKEGLTYTVQDVVYTPTLGEIAEARSSLRTQIYNQAQAELGRVKALYPKADYNVYSINFVDLKAEPGPMMAKVNTLMALTRETPNVALSQQLTQDALVVLAAPADKVFCNH